MTLPHLDAPPHGTLEHSWRPDLVHYCEFIWSANVGQDTIRSDLRIPIPFVYTETLCRSRATYANQIDLTSRHIHALIKSDRVFFDLIDRKFWLFQ